MACSSCAQAREAAAKAAGQFAKATTNLASGNVTKARANMAEAIKQVGVSGTHIGNKLGSKNFLPKRPVK